jgi:hypothetical protein
LRSDGDLEARGVYFARYKTIDGQRIAYAIDSRHRELTRTAITHAADADRVVGVLWDLLDMVDPAPRLQLLKGCRSAPAEAF